MRSSIRTLSSSNSQTVICDYLYLIKDGALQDINDKITSSAGSSDFSSSNLTDNSITDIVLTDLCYSNTLDKRITFNIDSTTININNSNVITFEETEIQINENVNSIADITTIGNISCSTLGGNSLTNYILNSNFTDDSIGDIVLENVSFASTTDQRLTLSLNNTYITAPTNLYL